MAQLKGNIDEAQRARAILAYRPSWVDRLTAWVVRRPGPAWLYYLGAAGLFYAADLLVKWWDKGIASGAISRWSVLVAVTGFFYLAAMHYLDEVARHAMVRFRPAVEAPTPRVAELEYQLTSMPSQAVWLMTLLGGVAGILTLAGITSGALAFPGLIAFASVSGAVLDGASIILSGTFSTIAIYHTIHQLRTVSMIYTELTKVDLFRQAPLHAFARLAAYTALCWIIPAYFWLTSGLEAAAFGIALGYLFVVMLLGVITFTWPLLGIHRLLAAEKVQLQDTVSKRLELCLQAFDQAFERGDLTQMDALNKAIDSAEREHRIADALPTWPWQPGLLRGALTAFLLPLILWVATRVLERFFGP
jgi:hypothetical protein